MKTINLIELLKRCKKGDKEALGLFILPIQDG